MSGAISLGGVGFRVLLDTGAKLFKFAGEQKAFAMPPMILVLNDGKFQGRITRG